MQMKWIDAFLDQITIYRVVLYYLIGLLGVAVIMARLGWLPFSPIDILFCSAFLVTICWTANKLLAYLCKAPTNPESSLITALILALIITPAHTAQGLLFLAVAGVLAMASKYILAIHKRHIFNPAAIAVVMTAYVMGNSASWWLGTAVMLPFVLAGGILLVRRIRRVAMVTLFIAVALVSGAIIAFLNGTDPILMLQQVFLSSALVFVGCVMLAEPLTSPTTKTKQIWYALFAGVLFSPQLHIDAVYSTPELVLLAGNVFTYVLGQRAKTLLRLRKRILLSHDSQELIFTPEKRLNYKPGQYMEFTFQHKHADSRGARRFFTLASSPTEPDIHLGVKFYEPGSSYKHALLRLNASQHIVAAQLGGDFTLPDNPKQKVVFIAGGIGITPYRSMLKYMIDTDQQRPTTLIYAARTPEDIVFRNIIDTAQTKLGIHVAYATGNVHVDADFIKKHAPDYQSCLFYISGPHGMVVALEDALKDLGLPQSQIKKDFFAGYA